MAELDRQAQPHFDQAKKSIPAIAENLSSVSSISCMCWYMLFNKAALEKYLNEQLKPLIASCSRGAAVYGVDLDTTAFHALTAEVGKDNLRSAAYAVAGLGMEAVFAKTLLRSISRVLGVIAARLAASWGGAAGLAAADGPLPIGDIVGVVMGVGGTVWSAYDLWQCSAAYFSLILRFPAPHLFSCRECRKKEKYNPPFLFHVLKYKSSVYKINMLYTEVR